MWSPEGRWTSAQTTRLDLRLGFDAANVPMSVNALRLAALVTYVLSNRHSSMAQPSGANVFPQVRTWSDVIEQRGYLRSGC